MLFRRNKNKSIFESGRDWIYWRTRNVLIKFRHLQPDGMYAKRRFKKMLGYELDLRSPKTLNEKIQWLKLYDRRPIHRICADKLAVRDHVAERIGEDYLIPLLRIFAKSDELVPERMPDPPFVLKGNLDQGSVVIVRDIGAADWPFIRARMKRVLRKNDYWKEREWQYGGSGRRIIVEKALLLPDGRPPPDFKLHCFNGKALIIQIDQDRYEGHKRVLYDRAWNIIEAEWSHPMGRPIDKPAQVSRLIDLAEQLAREFDYVRVDFYLFEDRIYFGEMTFHPQAGFAPFRPASFDLAFGEQLVLTPLKTAPKATARSALS